MQAKDTRCNQSFRLSNQVLVYRRVTPTFNFAVQGVANTDACIVAVDTRGHLHLIHGDNAVEPVDETGALAACRQLLKAEAMQQGDRSGYVMGAVSAAIDMARAAVEPLRHSRQRLEYLRGELRAERISYGELAELQSLAAFIDPDDVELLEAAGVPESSDPSPVRLDPGMFRVEFAVEVEAATAEDAYEAALGDLAAGEPLVGDVTDADGVTVRCGL